MIRFYVTYYCGWWCRGSTHLQIPQQGWTAYNKMPQESWPVYETGTYTEVALTEATNTVAVAASLNRLIDLPWRTIATSCSTTRTCAQLESQLQNHSTFHLWRSMHIRHAPTDQRTCITSFCPSVWIHQAPFEPLHANTFGYQYKPRNYELSIIQWFNSPYIHHQINIMDAMYYWLFSQKYSIWNVTIPVLQFWMSDFKPHVLSDAIEWVYTAFFCTATQHNNYRTCQKKYYSVTFWPP